VLTWLLTLCIGLDYCGQDWRWETLLEKLHSLLDSETEGDALAWLDDGWFVVEQKREARLAVELGLRVCSLRQALEALGFECREELQGGYAVFRHESFVRSRPDLIERILEQDVSFSGSEAEMEMPNVAYSSALKPLEVRLSLPAARSQCWEVTIAPSVLPHPSVGDVAGCRFPGDGGFGAINDWGDVLDDLDECSDHDMSSPMWWSQRSDFSSICTDDLSDMDSLSQTSAYYA
jgi:hypothetical protein